MVENPSTARRYRRLAATAETLIAQKAFQKLKLQDMKFNRMEISCGSVISTFILTIGHEYSTPDAIRRSRFIAIRQPGFHHLIGLALVYSRPRRLEFRRRG